MLAVQLAEAVASAPLSLLDDLSRDVWRGMAAGMIGDDDAQRLAELIHARRSIARTLEVAARAQDGRPARAWSFFPPRRPPQGPQSRVRSIERRRRLAASGPMPPALASRFTTGELAVLAIVAAEVKAHGSCSRTIAEISARAGVSLSTTRNAMHAAARIGAITIEHRRRHRQRNLANVIRIVSVEWTTWLARGGCKFLRPTDTKVLNREGRGGWNSPRKAEPARARNPENALKGPKLGQNGRFQAGFGPNPRNRDSG